MKQKEKLVQLLSEMVGQAISLSVVEPETKTADFVKNWLDNHYEEVGAAFGLSCCYGKGLDEAAEEYNMRSAARHWENKTEGEQIEAAFKAGAKWMEKQFDLEADGEITQRPDGTLGVCIYIDERSGYKFGDKVIVQIRKKEE